MTVDQADPDLAQGLGLSEVVLGQEDLQHLPDRQVQQNPSTALIKVSETFIPLFVEKAFFSQIGLVD